MAYCVMDKYHEYLLDYDKDYSALMQRWSLTPPEDDPFAEKVTIQEISDAQIRGEITAYRRKTWNES